MSQTANPPPLNWSDLGMSVLVPTGTVTLLLADVEGSTRLWETQPDLMTAAITHLQSVADECITVHGGVRPIEQGEGDSFVAAFTRASDAVACALDLQRAPLAPIRLRIGVHTGEVQLRDDANYAGPTINRTARLRDLAHGGQTLLSGAAEPLVVDHLPNAAWLIELGTHRLRDLPRPDASCSYAIPIWETNSRRSEQQEPLTRTIFRFDSRVSSGVKAKCTSCTSSSQTTGLSR